MGPGVQPYHYTFSLLPWDSKPSIQTFQTLGWRGLGVCIPRHRGRSGPKTLPKACEELGATHPGGKDNKDSSLRVNTSPLSPLILLGWGCFWSSLMFCPSSRLLRVLQQDGREAILLGCQVCGSEGQRARGTCAGMACTALPVVVPNYSLPQNLPRPPGCDAWNVFRASMFSSRHQEGANGALGSGELQETSFTAHILAARGPLDRAPLHQGAAGCADHNPGSPEGRRTAGCLLP